MSRRRSRLAPAVGSDREPTVDDFLKGVARTPRSGRRFLGGASVLKQSKPSLAPTLIPNRHGKVRKEATFLLETLAAIEKDEAKQGDSAKLLKRKKSIQRVNSEDQEWEILIGNRSGSAVSKNRRRKHYVVYNSLPLARQSPNGGFQFSGLGLQPCGLVSDSINTQTYEGNRKICDIPGKGRSVRSAKPLLPVSVIRSMIMSPRPKSEYNLTRTSNNTKSVVSRVKPRDKPGSGFDCTSESLRPRSAAVGGNSKQIPTGGSVLEMVDHSTPLPKREVLPLSFVPDAIFGQLSSGIPAGIITQIPRGRSRLNYVALKSPTGVRRVNGFKTISEKPLSAHFRAYHSAVKTNLPGLALSKVTGNSINVSRPYSSPGKRELQAPPQRNQETCENADGGWVLVGKVADRNNASLGSQGSPEILSIDQEGPPSLARLFLNDYERAHVLPRKALATDRKPKSTITTRNAVERPRSIEISVPQETEEIEADEYSFVLGVSPQSPIGTYSGTSLTPVSGLGRLGRVGPMPVGREFVSRTPLPGKCLRGSLVPIGGLGQVDLGQELSTYQRHQKRKVLISEVEEAREEEKQIKPPVSRRLFTENSPGDSYFSIAQRALKKGLDNGAGFSSLGYLRRSAGVTRRLSIVDEVISEEEQSAQRDESPVITGIIPTSIYNLNCTVFSTPTRTPGAPVALKDLLDRTAKKRRPSISGIFRGRPSAFSNLKFGDQGSGRVILSEEADPGHGLALGIEPPPIASGLRNTYVRREGSKVLRPYVLPLGKSPPV